MFRFLGVLVFVWIATTSVTHAAYLYIDPSDPVLYRGDSTVLTVRIDTDESECINAVDVTVKYDEGVRVVDVTRGDSILNIWLEDPKINDTEHTVTFAGGITGGYCGRAVGDPGLSNVLVSLVFQSPGFAIGGGNSPIPSVSFGDTTRVLLNDGFGTEAILRTDSARITLSDTPGATYSDSWTEEVNNDTDAPSDFGINLTRIETAFSGQYFISWMSHDKQTGIDHYELMEEPLEDLYSFTWGGANAPWIVAESPYVLKDQTLNSTIRVKAIDKAGNETIAVLVPDMALRSLSINRMITCGFVGGIALVSLVIISLVLLERKRQLVRSYDSKNDA